MVHANTVGWAVHLAIICTFWTQIQKKFLTLEYPLHKELSLRYFFFIPCDIFYLNTRHIAQLARRPKDFDIEKIYWDKVYKLQLEILNEVIKQILFLQELKPLELWKAHLSVPLIHQAQQIKIKNQTPYLYQE